MTFSYSNIVQLNTRISVLGARKHEWIVQGTAISQMDGHIARLNQMNTCTLFNCIILELKYSRIPVAKTGLAEDEGEN